MSNCRTYYLIYNRIRYDITLATSFCPQTEVEYFRFRGQNSPRTAPDELAMYALRFHSPG